MSDNDVKLRYIDLLGWSTSQLKKELEKHPSDSLNYKLIQKVLKEKAQEK